MNRLRTFLSSLQIAAASVAVSEPKMRVRICRVRPRVTADAVDYRPVAGEWPSGKAPDSGSGDPRFES